MLSPWMEQTVESHVFYLKFNKINMKLIKFLRKRQQGESSEKSVIDEYLGLIRLGISRFSSTVGFDEAELPEATTPNQLFALRKRY